MSDHLRAVMESVSDAILLVDLSRGAVTDANTAACALFQRSKEELEEGGLASLWDRDVVVDALVETQAKEGRYRGELLLRRSDGTRFIADVSTVALGVDTPLEASLVVRDLTATRAAQASLHEANNFLDEIIENIPNMIFVKDAERLAFARFNRAGEVLLGVPRAALLGKNDFDFFPQAEAEFFQKKDRETLERGLLVDIPEEPIETARGPRVLHTKKVPIRDSDGKPIFLLGISEDITDSRAAEEAKRRLVAIVRDSNDAIIGRTLDGRVTSWNRGAEKIFGYAEAEVVGQSIDLLFPENKKDEELRLKDRLAANEHIPSFTTTRLRKDGSEVDVSITLSPISNAQGEVVGISKIARDITDLNRIIEDLARAKAAADAANRELESFSYSVAHDLRAPLRAIDGFSQALVEDYEDKLDATGREFLKNVRDAAQLMAQLIDDMLMLSRVTRSELRRERVDVSALAEATLSRLARSNTARSVEVVVQKDVTALGDARLLGILFENLLGNAWKFTSKKSGARIEVGVTAHSPPTFFVRDNGAGFDDEYVHKLFGVFQRLHTSREFEGTGVGLAIVKRIVERHGGRAWAEGKVDEGATFYFTLEKEESV